MITVTFGESCKLSVTLVNSWRLSATFRKLSANLVNSRRILQTLGDCRQLSASLVKSQCRDSIWSTIGDFSLHHCNSRRLSDQLLVTLVNSRRLSSTHGDSRQLPVTLVNSPPLLQALGDSRQLSATLVNSRRLSSTLRESRKFSAPFVNSP